MELNGITLHGWCSPDKARYLGDWIAKNQPRVIVEIGVYGGACLLPMAYEAMKYHPLTPTKVVGIDPWDVSACLEGMVEEHNRDWWERHSHLGPVYASCKAAIASLGLTNIELWVGTSDQYAGSFEPQQINLISIDGNHGFPVERDVRNYLRLLAPGALIAMDDTDWVEGGVKHVRRAIDFLIESGCTELAVVDGCTMLMRSEEI